MKKSLIFITCILLGTVIFSYAGRISDPPATWQQQLETFKANPVKCDVGDTGVLRLVGYSYKGVISSEEEKSRILDAIFSDESPILLTLGKVELPADTIYRGDTCIVENIVKYEFDILTAGRIAAMADSLGVRNPIPQARKEVAGLILLGFDLIELQWDFNGRPYTTLGIASNDHGGMVYDPIGTAHATTTSVTKTSVHNVDIP